MNKDELQNSIAVLTEKIVNHYLSLCESQIAKTNKKDFGHVSISVAVSFLCTAIKWFSPSQEDIERDLELIFQTLKFRLSKRINSQQKE